MKKTVLAGMRPTNMLHIGNYLGSAKGMVELQNNSEYETFYMVVDLHAITTPYDKSYLKAATRNVVLDYLACGLDPEKSVIFIQSDLADLHTQLAFYFSSAVTVARMRHLPTFKEKAKQHPEAITMALLNYPVLMAADILMYKASQVPVGLDQEPHIEVAREIARKMNSTYGTDFPDPKRFTISGGEYVPSLTGEGKMSKSVEGSYITLSDDLETIESKLARVPTDSGSGREIPTEGGVSALLTLVEIFLGNERKKEFENQYKTTSIRYGDLKKELAKAVYETLEPIQKKRKEVEGNPKYIDKVLQEGTEKARIVATKTIQEVKAKMGLC